MYTPIPDDELDDRAFIIELLQKQISRAESDLTFLDPSTDDGEWEYHTIQRAQSALDYMQTLTTTTPEGAAS